MEKVDRMTLKIEIGASVLKRLLRENQICAADLSCLDQASKDRMLRLCLESCSARRCPDPMNPACVNLAPGFTQTGKPTFLRKYTLEKKGTDIYADELIRT